MYSELKGRQEKRERRYDRCGEETYYWVEGSQDLTTTTTPTTTKHNGSSPGTVKGRNSVGIGAGVFQQFDEVIPGHNTGRDDIGKSSHGSDLYCSVLYSIVNVENYVVVVPWMWNKREIEMMWSFIVSNFCFCSRHGNGNIFISRLNLSASTHHRTNSTATAAQEDTQDPIKIP